MPRKKQHQQPVTLSYELVRKTTAGIKPAQRIEDLKIRLVFPETEEDQKQRADLANLQAARGW